MELDKSHIPQHVAVIMDGNGRWAKKQLQRRIFGHQHAITAVRQTLEAAIQCGVKYLTLYTFSTENWNRPQEEVDGLMELLSKAILDETKTMLENGVSMHVIGDMSRLPVRCRQQLQQCIETTAGGNNLSLILALSYSSRWELTNAVRSIASKVASGVLTADDVNEQLISSHLATAQYPDPDLLIRTGGELRISNFLLWQMAYTEFYFTDLLWPDFRREHFFEAVKAYQQRQRRFGKTGDQVGSV